LPMYLLRKKEGRQIDVNSLRAPTWEGGKIIALRGKGKKREKKKDTPVATKACLFQLTRVSGRMRGGEKREKRRYSWINTIDLVRKKRIIKGEKAGKKKRRRQDGNKETYILYHVRQLKEGKKRGRVFRYTHLCSVV